MIHNIESTHILHGTQVICDQGKNLVGDKKVESTGIIKVAVL
jgi:hypothetical protein